MMKIVMPVNEKSMESEVSMSFGRTPFFLIYDTKSKESFFIDNTAANSPGGAGIKAAQIVVDNKPDALLTPRCGENAAAVMIAAKVKIYKTLNSSIQDNITAFIEEKLLLLEEMHEGFHNHGAK